VAAISCAGRHNFVVNRVEERGTKLLCPDSATPQPRAERYAFVVFAPIRVPAVRVRALWGSPLQGLRVSFDAGTIRGRHIADKLFVLYVLSKPCTANFSSFFLQAKRKRTIFAVFKPINQLVMARPIKETPELKGKDAIRFEKIISKPAPVSKEWKESSKKAYEFLKSISNFQF
jgi:hypothetical protein